MSTTRSRIATSIMTVLAVLMVAGSAYAASAPPVKEILVRSLGRQVNRTQTEAKTGAAAEDVCTVASHDTCQTAQAGGKPGEFNYPDGIAGDEAGDVYIAETGNNRVQELGPDGEFILMFGRNVNATKVKENASQEERDICTAASKDQCQEGEAGAQPGALKEPARIAVDRVTGNVYVGDGWPGPRVDEFDAGGHFVLRVGHDVNTSGGNICTEQEIEQHTSECQQASKAASPTEHDAFTALESLAVDSTSHVLYVGDFNRLQEIASDGKWVGEPVSQRLQELSSARDALVTALAVDDAGDVYLVYQNVGSPEGGEDMVREFDTGGAEVASLTVAPRNPVYSVGVTGIAVGAGGRLAVLGSEIFPRGSVWFGRLYDAPTSQEISSFTIAESASEVAFAGPEALDTATGHELSSYVAVPVAELRTGSALCVPGVGVGSDTAFDCDLGGEVNPEGVSGTSVWFEWGASSLLGEKTPAVLVPTGEALVPASAQASGLTPNETFFYQLAGLDINLPPSEPASGGLRTATAPSSPPRVLGAPRSLFLTPSSAVVSGALNPENTATGYEFQYGACGAQTLESCPSALEATTLQSAAYGEVGVTQELRGLQPGTVYRYRLRAVNANGEAAVGEHGAPGVPEGTFETPLIASPQVLTGAPAAVGGSSAVVSGSVVGNGQPGTYTFELGAVSGAGTQYGVVASGSLGEGRASQDVSAALSDLQPGTEYAYKLVVHSGQFTVEGATMTFTTESLPATVGLPVVLPQLAVPRIAFPGGTGGSVSSRCKQGYQRSKLGKCTKTKTPKKKSAGKRRGKRKKA